MRAERPRRMRAATACAVALALAACYPKPRPDPSAGLTAPDDPFADLERLVDAELQAELASMACPEDAPRDHGRTMEEAAEVFDTSSTRTQLAFARAAARCRSPVAAAIVYRLVPALFLKRLEPREIEAPYAFLVHDRERSVALLRALLGDAHRGVDLVGVHEPRELAAFRPERVLSATCAKLSGLFEHRGRKVVLAIPPNHTPAPASRMTDGYPPSTRLVVSIESICARCGRRESTSARCGT